MLAVNLNIFVYHKYYLFKILNLYLQFDLQFTKKTNKHNNINNTK
jgi:hypothetical protein